MNNAGASASTSSMGESIESDNQKPSRAEHRRWSFWFEAWWMVPAHILLSTLVWALMVSYLPGTIAAIGRGQDLAQPPPGRWYQSDITTGLAISLVATRTLAGILQVTTTWRGIWLLLQEATLTFTELEWMSSFSLPTIGVTRHHSSISSIWLVALLLLVAWPAQFASPLATGSLTWIPNTTFDADNRHTTKGVLGSGISDTALSWFNMYDGVRTGWIEGASGFANLEQFLVVDRLTNDTVPPARRPTFRLRDLDNGSSIASATVPYFAISSFEWVTEPAKLDEALLQAVMEGEDGVLSISKPANPMQVTAAGIAAPLRTTPWQGVDHLSTPLSAVFDEPIYAALHIARFGNPDQSPCSFDKGTTFREIPSAALLPQHFTNNHTTCFAFAKLQITAGTVECVNNHKGASCALSPTSPLAIIARNPSSPPAPSALTPLAMAIMPEVIALMVSTGFSNAHTSSIDATAYLRAALTLAFQGSWTNLAECLATENLPVDVTEPTSVVVAAVARWRMHVWLGLQAVLVLVAVVMAVVQGGKGKEVLVRPIVKLILLDSRALGNGGRRASNRFHFACRSSQEIDHDDNTLVYDDQEERPGGV